MSDTKNHSEDDESAVSDESEPSATKVQKPTLSSLLRFPLKWPRSSQGRAVTTTMAGAAVLAAVRLSLIHI